MLSKLISKYIRIILIYMGISSLFQELSWEAKPLLLRWTITIGVSMPIFAKLFREVPVQLLLINLGYLR